MKKLIPVIILSVVCSYALFAQENDLIQKNIITYSNSATANAPHFNRYVGTYMIYASGIALDSVCFCAPYYHCPTEHETIAAWKINPITIGQSDAFNSSNDTMKIPHGFAQIINNDSIFKIGGISFATNLTPETTMRTNTGDTVLIIDKSTMEVLYEKVLNDTISIPVFVDIAVGFYEIIFDSAIQVEGDFLIAYKYNRNNIIYDIAEVMPGLTYVSANYSIPLSIYVEMSGLNDIPSYTDRLYLNNDNSTNQIYYYTQETGWLTCLDYRNYFSISPPTQQGSMTSWISSGIDNNGWYSNLYPEDRSIAPHTTDICVFAIPESAINRQTDTSGFSSITSIDNENAISITPNPTNDIVNYCCPVKLF
ncbi:MAG: hypothetical protein HUK18_02660 [Bacteroidales bacterium]|nr:hypothetical protein [Bacteroidales bacterium]